MSFHSRRFAGRSHDHIMAQTGVSDEPASQQTSVPPSVGADVSGIETYSPQIFRKFSVKVISSPKGRNSGTLH